MPASKSNETAVLFVTDTHLGKKTKSFTPKKAHDRLQKLAAKVADIKGLLGGGYEFKELVVCLLGDMIDGTGIYPTQPHHQEETSAIAQVEAFAQSLGDAIDTLSTGFKKTRVECVPGNHGRVSKFAHEADSWDVIAYQRLQDRFKGSPVAVEYGGRKGLFVRRCPVGRWTYLLYHGHGVKMYQQIPWYGLFTRLGRWATTSQFGRFDAFACGHFHTNGSHQLNRIRVLMNGTMVTDDEWALQEFGYASSNQWWLVGASDKHATTFQYPLTV